MCERALCKRSLPKRRRCEARYFAGGEFDEHVDCGARDAKRNTDLVVREPTHERKTLQRRLRRQTTHTRQNALVGDVDVRDADVVRSGAAEATDVPCVQNLVVGACYDRVDDRYMRDRFTAAAALHEAGEYPTVVAAADELPTSVDTEPSVDFIGRAD